MIVLTQGFPGLKDQRLEWFFQHIFTFKHIEDVRKDGLIGIDGSDDLFKNQSRFGLFGFTYHTVSDVGTEYSSFPQMVAQLLGILVADLGKEWISRTARKAAEYALVHGMSELVMANSVELPWGRFMPRIQTASTAR